MEFIIISSPDLEEHKPSLRKAIMAAPMLAPVDGPFGFYDMGSLMVAANGHQSNDVCTVGFDGAAISDARAYSSGNGSAPLISEAVRYIDDCLDKFSSADLRGSFCFMRFNPHTKAFNVVTDPLSLYPVFVCGFGDTLIASNNIYVIQSVVTAMGLHLTRSSKAGIYQTLYSGGAKERTGFREIALLPAGQQIAGIGPNWRFVSKAQPKPADINDYPEALNRAATRISNSVAAIAKSTRDQELSLNISGGFGSRLVLAAVVASGVRNIKVQCSDSLNAETEQIAVQLAAQFGIHPAKSSISSKDKNTDLLAAMRQDVFLQQGLGGAPMTARTNARFQNFSMLSAQGIELLGLPGMQSNKGNLFWRSPLQHIAKISNSDPVYSVCLKALLSGTFDRQKRGIARSAYVICNSRHRIHSLFRRDFIRSSTREILAQLQQNLMDTKTTPVEAYLNTNMCRNLGLTSRILNCSHGYYSIFADPVLLECAAVADQVGLQKGSFILDLLEKLGGARIFEQPFTGFASSKAIRQQLAKRLNKPEKAIFLNPKKPADPSNKTNTELLTSARLQRINGEFEALINALPINHECWRYFNRRTLYNNIKNSDFFGKNSLQKEDEVLILHTLIWAAGAEDKMGIEHFQ